MKREPLFGTGVAAKSLAVTAQRRLNCYYELVLDGDKTKIAIYGTPGLTLFKFIGAAPIRGAWAVGLYAYIAQAGRLYRLDLAGNITLLGTLNTSSGFVSICDNGFQVLVVDGTNGYTYTIASGVFAQITSANFPNGATTCAFQDGFFLVEDPSFAGRWFKSASYDGQTWSALDNGVMVSSSNPCTAVDSDNGYVIVWGTLAVEFWQNIGTAGFPFFPNRSMSREYGLAAKWSRAKVNSAMCFLAQNRQGQVTVMKLSPGGDKKISTSDIDAAINSFAVQSDATALSYVIDGHPMYEITFPTAGRSFLYDDSTEMWSEVQTGVDLIGRHAAQFGFAWNGDMYVTDYATGNLYTLDPAAYTDNGATIKRLIQTRHQYRDGNEFALNELLLDMETGVGLQSGQGSNPQICLQVSKDGGRTFGLERWAPIGLVGQYDLIGAHWTRMGSAHDFVLRFWMTDPVKFAISAGYADISKGAQ